MMSRTTSGFINKENLHAQKQPNLAKSNSSMGSFGTDITNLTRNKQIAKAPSKIAPGTIGSMKEKFTPKQKPSVHDEIDVAHYSNYEYTLEIEPVDFISYKRAGLSRRTRPIDELLKENFIEYLHDDELDTVIENIIPFDEPMDMSDCEDMLSISEPEFVDMAFLEK